MNSNKELEQLQVSMQQSHATLDQLEAKACPASPPMQCCPLAQCNVAASAWPFIADFNIPLLAAGGGDCNPDIARNLGPLAGLIGTWVSTRSNGFNVMPIPQATAPNGFILKNFFYYEVMTFSAIQSKFVNRGGVGEQDCYTLFYEQRVFFSDGEQANQLVHAENGTWLHLITGPQGQGPLNQKPDIPSPHAPNPIPAQNPAQQIVKQVSVPHGISILASGDARLIQGAPVIPDANALPVGAPPAWWEAYGPELPDNTSIHPNIVLQDALIALNNLGIDVVRTRQIHVDSDKHGSVSNTEFIKRHSNVTRFMQTLWLEELSNGQLLLQYSQNISLKFAQTRGKSYVFPHITANTLFKVK